MSTHDDQTSDFRGFPGGRVQLPRLNKPKKLVNPEITDDATDETASDAGGTAGRRSTKRSAPRRSDVGEGPIRRKTARSDHRGAEPTTDATIEVDGSFLDYFTTDSLFGASPDVDDDMSDATAAAYSTLGVSRRAPWKTVTRAHRELVAMLHPDRYVDADDAVREAAEERVRDVNEAYALLREQRAPTRA